MRKNNFTFWWGHDAPEPGGREVGGQRSEVSGQPELPTSDLWRVITCRAKEGHCPFALTGLSQLKLEIEAMLEISGWNAFLRRRLGTRILPHHTLRIALAACPNACSRPQIADVGIIAASRPVRVLQRCTACGKCERTCREHAIVVENDIAQLRGDTCLACGECVVACPVTAIVAQPLHFRVMIGGRMGRHPRWADELPGVFDADEVPGLILRFVSLAIDEMRPGERVSDFVQHLSRNLRLLSDLPGVHR